MDEKTRRGFFECLCSFMSGHEGLTQEDMIKELRDCGFAPGRLTESQKQIDTLDEISADNVRLQANVVFKVPLSLTLDTDGYEIKTLSTLRKGDIFLDRTGLDWVVEYHARSLTHVKRAIGDRRGHFVKDIDVRIPKIKEV
jgi:hypothetical protein